MKIEWTTPENSEVTSALSEFLKDFNPLERSLYVMLDQKSSAYYICCHLQKSNILDKMDFKATIYDDDLNDDEPPVLYKLNRDITENQYAFTVMVADAQKGRTFEDIVVEFDKTYNNEQPLKIYGGQHRIKAILSENTPHTIYHGFRVYFGLTKEQKVEIATINNTSIAVSTDLLDRMKEQLLGSELRDYFQHIGLLQDTQDFSDSKSSEIPTVRIGRTFVLNYWKAKNNKDNKFHTPVVCKSGGMDSEYEEIRKYIYWNDEVFLEAGRQFALLNKTQKDKVSNRRKDTAAQFASKALSLAVVASWSYAAGLYSNNEQKLKILYSLVNNLGTDEDPLGAKALSEARYKGSDPDTYRGLGARISSDELGRMLEVFDVLIRLTIEKQDEQKITLKLANAAIQSYEAKKASYNALITLSKV